MFDPEFYPTPSGVIDLMGIDCYDRNVLEPSAGSGNIVEWLKKNGAYRVQACEQHPDLRKILSGKCEVLAEDFFSLTADQVSHVHQIVMNPPFSNAERHIRHAWDIAPEGCEIIALCNWQTLENAYSSYRESLGSIIKDYGEKQNLGPVFNKADRRTSVEIGLVRLFKPIVSDSTMYDGFYFDLDEQPNKNGIVRYDEIRSYVNIYVGALRCFDAFQTVGNELNSIMRTAEFGNGFAFNVSHGESITTKQDFARKLQMHLWNKVFRRVNIDRLVTKGVRSDINTFIQSRQNYPFTVKNIWRMIEIIVGTQSHTMNKSIEDVVDWFTRYTKENQYGVEGWKTNAGHLLNKKFILQFITDPPSDYRPTLSLDWYQGNCERLTDLTKVLCFLTGKDYSQIPNIQECGESGNNFIAGKWYDWGFFEFRVYKKRSGHFKFKNLNDWEKLNRAYAKTKGQVLPNKI